MPSGLELNSSASSFSFLTHQTEDLLDLSQVALERQFSEIRTTPKNQLSPFSGSQLFNPGSHVTSNCGHDARVPLGRKFQRVNPLLQQLHRGVSESHLQAHTSAGGAAAPGMHPCSQSPLIDLAWALAQPPSARYRPVRGAEGPATLGMGLFFLHFSCLAMFLEEKVLE